MNSFSLYLGGAGGFMQILSWAVTLSVPYLMWRVVIEKPSKAGTIPIVGACYGAMPPIIFEVFKDFPQGQPIVDFMKFSWLPLVFAMLSATMLLWLNKDQEGGLQDEIRT